VSAVCKLQKGQKGKAQTIMIHGYGDEKAVLSQGELRRAAVNLHTLIRIEVSAALHDFHCAARSRLSGPGH